MKRLVLPAFFALALSATPALGQVAVYGGGGAAFPTGDDLEDVDAGLQLFGGVTFDVASRLALYAEGQWGTHDIADNDDITVKPMALMGGFIFDFLSDENAPVSPYAFAGAGIQTVKIDADALGEAEDSTFGWQLGAGVGFDLAGIGAFAEGRYQAASFDADTDVGELDFALFSLAVGLSFDLGGN